MLKRLVMLLIQTLLYKGHQIHDGYFSVPELSNKMCIAENVEFQTETMSLIACAQKCTMYTGCKSLIVYRDNHTCFGIKTHEPTFLATPLQGATFYRPSDNLASTTTTVQISSTTAKDTTTTTHPGCFSSSPLIVGVFDFQMTASSDYTLMPGYTAPFGRLDNPLTCWVSFENTQEEYIQVDFQSLRMATAVITQGDPIYNDWVTSFRMFYSDDCANYVVVKDEAGNDMVYSGNKDRSTHCTNVFETPIVSRCFRLNPITWDDDISLRFEIIGCTV